mmetsp:Transcript_10294/g.11530  ORF Transcript_10294/g.11530 Transcript_10294/m.11530 type:complete len:161 (-) Transcript_10294:144-626(-)
MHCKKKFLSSPNKIASLEIANVVMQVSIRLQNEEAEEYKKEISLLNAKLEDAISEAKSAEQTWLKTAIEFSTLSQLNPELSLKISSFQSDIAELSAISSSLDTEIASLQHHLSRLPASLPLPVTPDPADRTAHGVHEGLLRRSRFNGGSAEEGLRAGSLG